MPKTDAQKRASKKWDSAHLTMLGVQIKRELAEQFKFACAANGDTVAGVFRAAIDDYLRSRGGGCPPPPSKGERGC